MSPERILKCSVIAGIVGIVLNVLLSMLLAPMATRGERKPGSGGPAALPFKSQVMHMLVHHKQVLFTSSAIVFVLVALSTAIAMCCV